MRQIGTQAYGIGLTRGRKVKFLSLRYGGMIAGRVLRSVMTYIGGAEKHTSGLPCLWITGAPHIQYMVFHRFFCHYCRLRHLDMRYRRGGNTPAAGSFYIREKQGTNSCCHGASVPCRNYCRSSLIERKVKDIIAQCRKLCKFPD